MPACEPRTAWDLIGWDDGAVRVVGGRVDWEAVDNFGGWQVRLQRLVPSGDRLRVLTRYVDADTKLVPADDMARARWADWGRS